MQITILHTPGLILKKEVGRLVKDYIFDSDVLCSLASVKPVFHEKHKHPVGVKVTLEGDVDIEPLIEFLATELKELQIPVFALLFEESGGLAAVKWEGGYQGKYGQIVQELFKEAGFEIPDRR